MDTAPPFATSSTDRRTEAWTRLQTGNAHWVAGTTGDHSGRSPQGRADLVAGQTPFAAVLSCADSRVPAELVFDQGPGDLFVVRTAGHALDDTVLGSLEYAVSVLGVDLVLVMGHGGCGAVAAAAQTLAGGTAPRRPRPHRRRASQPARLRRAPRRADRPDRGLGVARGRHRGPPAAALDAAARSRVRRLRRRAVHRVRTGHRPRAADAGPPRARSRRQRRAATPDPPVTTRFRPARLAS